MPPHTATTDPDVNVLTGEVVSIVNMGAQLHFVCLTAEGRITVIQPNRQGPLHVTGEAVSLQFGADDCVLLAPDVQ